MTEEPSCRITQSGLTAWWAVMRHCTAAGVDPEKARDWLDEAHGRHYADALIEAVGLETTGPFEFQATNIATGIADNPRVDPARCIRGEAGSSAVEADAFIERVRKTLNPHPSGAGSGSVH